MEVIFGFLLLKLSSLSPSSDSEMFFPRSHINCDSNSKGPSPNVLHHVVWGEGVI